jgi:hypothetical protein
VSRRYLEGETRTSIESLWKARDTLFEAQRAALQSDASWLRLRVDEPSRPRGP